MKILGKVLTAEYDSKISNGVHLAVPQYMTIPASIRKVIARTTSKKEKKSFNFSNFVIYVITLGPSINNVVSNSDLFDQTPYPCHLFFAKHDHVIMFTVMSEWDMWE